MEEYVLLVQKGKKELEKENEEMRHKLDQYEKELEQGEMLLYDKENLVKKQ